MGIFPCLNSLFPANDFLITTPLIYFIPSFPAFSPSQSLPPLFLPSLPLFPRRHQFVGNLVSSLCNQVLMARERVKDDDRIVQTLSALNDSLCTAHPRSQPSSFFPVHKRSSSLRPKGAREKKNPVLFLKIHVRVFPGILRPLLLFFVGANVNPGVARDEI